MLCVQQRCLSVKWESNIMTSSLPQAAKIKIFFPCKASQEITKTAALTAKANQEGKKKSSRCTHTHPPVHVHQWSLMSQLPFKGKPLKLVRKWVANSSTTWSDLGFSKEYEMDVTCMIFSESTRSLMSVGQQKRGQISQGSAALISWIPTCPLAGYLSMSGCCQGSFRCMGSGAEKGPGTCSTAAFAAVHLSVLNQQIQA